MINGSTLKEEGIRHTVALSHDESLRFQPRAWRPEVAGEAVVVNQDGEDVEALQGWGVNLGLASCFGGNREATNPKTSP